MCGALIGAWALSRENAIQHQPPVAGFGLLAWAPNVGELVVSPNEVASQNGRLPRRRIPPEQLAYGGDEGNGIGHGVSPSEPRETSTVKDLVAGSGIEFEDRGSYVLKGVPGEWHLFAVA